MDFSSKVLGNPDDECSLFAVRHPEHRYARPELLPEAVHKLAQGVPVHRIDLADDGFDSLDVLRSIGQIVELGERSFALLIGKLFLQLLNGLREFFNVSEDGVFAHIELLLKLLQDFGLFLEMLERAEAGHGFDAADAGGDGLFTDDFEDADVADVVNMNPAAEFFRVKASRGAFVGNGNDADVGVRVFVSEKSERAGSKRVIE